MKKLIRAGATDQTLDVFIQDSASTTGGGKTGLAYNTASLVCYYRKGATGSATALTLATQTVGGAHSDGGFVEIDATNMPGLYRLDLSDTIVATAGSVSLMLKGASGMAPLPIELQVVSFNPEDAVRLGLTALPNAAADAAGGLPISDAGGLDLDAIKTDTAAILVDTGTDIPATLATIGGYLDTEVAAIKAKTDNLPADPADASDIAAAFGTVNSTLSTIAGYIDTEVAAIVTTLGTPAGASVSADIAAVKAQTAAIETDTQDIQTRIPAALTAGGNIKADVLALNGSTTAASNIAKTTAAIARGTVTAGGTTTSIPTSAFSPAGSVADQFKGRIVTFDADTTTAALRGQSTDITASTSASTPTLTVTALTTAPSSGDTFSVT